MLINEPKKLSDCSENWTLNVTAVARKKIWWWRDRSVNNFDTMKIRHGKSTKFNGAEVYWKAAQIHSLIQNILNYKQHIIPRELHYYTASWSQSWKHICKASQITRIKNRGAI